MAFVQTWDEGIPGGSRNLNLGDDDIRSFKAAIRERLAVDHRAYASEGANTNIGAHNTVSLIAQGSDPAAITAAGIVYTKLVAGVAELFIEHESAGVIQLTSGGKLLASAMTIASQAIGDLLYASSATQISRLAGNVTTTKKYYTQTGDGVNGAAPVLGTIALADLPISLGTSYFRYDTSNGYGSTNTKIPKFSTLTTNVGTDFTLSNSATLGLSITIVNTGVYSFAYNWRSTFSNIAGFSLNSNQLTTDLSAITATDRLVLSEDGGNGLGSASVTYRFAANDVIRPHADAVAFGAECNLMGVRIV